MVPSPPYSPLQMSTHPAEGPAAVVPKLEEGKGPREGWPCGRAPEGPLQASGSNLKTSPWRMCSSSPHFRCSTYHSLLPRVQGRGQCEISEKGWILESDPSLNPGTGSSHCGVLSKLYKPTLGPGFLTRQMREDSTCLKETEQNAMFC